MVDVNCYSMAAMSKILIPSLRRRGKRGVKSAIVNVSSVAARYAAPLQVLYSGTKAFNRFFSVALSGEVRVLCV